MECSNCPKASSGACTDCHDSDYEYLADGSAQWYCVLTGEQFDPKPKNEVKNG